jgi:hypothetical protein
MKPKPAHAILYTRLLNQQNKLFAKTAFFIFHFSFFIFFSCGTFDRPAKPSATGKAGEMIVVMSPGEWEGRAGEMVRQVFSQPVPMFLQPEPMFNLVHISRNNFTKLFETHRHIFMLEIDPALERASLEVSEDVWSFPQMVIRVKAPNDSILRRLMDRNEEAFIDNYLKTERRRLINSYELMANQTARIAVKNKFGIDMSIPEGYFVAMDEEDFMWLRRTGTRDDLEMGVLISVMPYTDATQAFLPELIRARRDSITKKYIPGQFPGSYMTTYPELRPEFREINFKGRFAIEARSLWRVEGDFMGGPYVNFTMVDENTSRLFMFDGFVYAPRFDKRDYMRQVEAVIYSTEFRSPEEEATSSK